MGNSVSSIYHWSNLADVFICFNSSYPVSLLYHYVTRVPALGNTCSNIQYSFQLTFAHLTVSGTLHTTSSF